jgi:ferredoxin-NADP reductase
MSRPLYDRMLRVQRIFEETPETKSFSLDVAGEPLEFEPGQFVNVTVETPGNKRFRRAYSIASSPLDPELLLTVKRIEIGRLSEYLCHALAPGDSLNIRGPYGRFVLHQDVQELVFIAAGSGIVPFRSMWRYVRQTRSRQNISLLYASKSARYVIYRNELDALGQAGYRVVHTFTRNDDPSWTGYSRRIDPDMLVEFVQQFSKKFFYVCGPPEFCDCIVSDLIGLRVERQNIKTEKYD